MPFVIARVNVPVGCAQEVELKRRLGEAIGYIPGKSEKNLLVDIEDDCHLFVAGSGAEPVAILRSASLATRTTRAIVPSRLWSPRRSVMCLESGPITSTCDFPISHRGAWLAITSIVACLAGIDMGGATALEITLFSDPMMGLAYECEPTLDRLQERYRAALVLRHAMVVLVRDVADFMTAEERALPLAAGISAYNKRLAQIYLEELSIGGLPMHMEGFRLFDESHRTSEPLCLAYEAARIVAPDAAETFLRRLRRATIVEGRMSTHTSVLREVAVQSELDLASFDQVLSNGQARAALRSDEALAMEVGVQGLPAMLVHSSTRSFLTSPLVGFDKLATLMDALIG